MELVDTHCHIQSVGESGSEENTRELWAKAPELQPDQLIVAAQEAGVTRLLCVGCDLEDSRLAVNFVQSRAQCWASIGIHPHEARHYAHDPEKQAAFAALASKPKVVAIGECGLDYFYNHSSKADQLQVLEFQLELAKRHGLPVVFHVREALDDFWPIFDRYPDTRGVLHSFTDTEANLQKALERGLFIGVNGIATFAKDPAQLAMYQAVPLEKLLLETDAPFLTPHPYRGSINQPKHIRRIADFVSDLRGESCETLSDVTTSNAQSLFGLH